MFVLANPEVKRETGENMDAESSGAMAVSILDAGTDTRLELA